MAPQQPIAASELQAAACAGSGKQTSDKTVDSPACNPYLKVFGTDSGVIEFELSDKTVTIGRDERADIRLPALVQRFWTAVLGSARGTWAHS